MARPHLKISVPKPCSENWATMQPQEQGRFCAACATTVTDFSKFTDRQLLDYFAANSGKTCGRFSPTQLNRPVYLETAPQPKFLSRTFAAVALFLGLATQTQAQKLQDHPTPSSAIEVPEKTGSGKTVGKIPEKVSGDKLVLSGMVIDSATHEPIAFGTVWIKGTKVYATTDISGSFKLPVPDAFRAEKFSVKIQYVGYRDGEFEINGKDMPLTREFIMAGISYPKVVSEPLTNSGGCERAVTIETPYMFTGEVTVRVDSKKPLLVKEVLVPEADPAISLRDKLRLSWWKFKNLFRKKDQDLSSE